MKPQAIAERQAAATKPTSMGRKIADIDRQQIHRLMPATRGGNRRFHTASISVKRPGPPVAMPGGTCHQHPQQNCRASMLTRRNVRPMHAARDASFSIALNRSLLRSVDCVPCELRAS
jgi:hypothetical protein